MRKYKIRCASATFRGHVTGSYIEESGSTKFNMQHNILIRKTEVVVSCPTLSKMFNIIYFKVLNILTKLDFPVFDTLVFVVLSLFF